MQTDRAQTIPRNPLRGRGNNASIIYNILLYITSQNQEHIFPGWILYTWVAVYCMVNNYGSTRITMTSLMTYTNHDNAFVVYNTPVTPHYQGHIFPGWMLCLHYVHGNCVRSMYTLLNMSAYWISLQINNVVSFVIIYLMYMLNHKTTLASCV